jgi:hypothetical protein
MEEIMDIKDRMKGVFMQIMAIVHTLSPKSKRDAVREVLLTTLRQQDAETEMRTKKACAEAAVKAVIPADLPHPIPAYLYARSAAVYKACMNAEVKEWTKKPE